MSILSRPTVVFAIVFACFAVLIPRIFLPLFRTKPSAPSNQFDDRKLFFKKNALNQLFVYTDFRRPHPPMAHSDNGDQVQHIPVRFNSYLKTFSYSISLQGSPPHMRGAHPHMRMHHPGANARQQPTPESSSSKSIVTLALPMYTVGIGIFFIYTCCKVCIDAF